MKLNNNGLKWLTVVPSKDIRYNDSLQVHNDFYDDVDFIIKHTNSVLDGRPIKRSEMSTSDYKGVKVIFKPGHLTLVSINKVD